MPQQTRPKVYGRYFNCHYKTELIKSKRPWKGLDDLEIATAERDDWFNRRQPFEYCDDLTPVEAEHAHYAHHQTPTPVGVSN